MSTKEYEYNEKIHATIINPYLSKDNFYNNCELIKNYNIKNISTSLLFLKDLKEYFHNSQVNLKTYVSYPLADIPTNFLNKLIIYAEDSGADEIEYVPKFNLLTRGEDESFARDIEAVLSTKLPLTLIFNKERLEKEYFDKALIISLELGIQNFQFGDGFSSKFFADDLKEIIDFSSQFRQIKIGSSIDNLEQVNQLLNAGADCIGSPYFHKIFREIKSS